MKKSLQALLITVLAFGTLSVTFAQLNAPQIAPAPGGSNSNSSLGANIKNIVLAFKDIATGVYSSLFVVALICFFFGIIRMFVVKDAAGKQDAYKFLGFGVIALFVMVGIWGLVGFLSSSLGIGIGGDIPTPSVPTSVRTS